MRTIITLAFSMVMCVQSAFAWGSIGWDDVKLKISKSDPEFVKLIEKSFVMDKSGSGVRMGPQFGERQGERISPFEFGAVDRETKERCLLVIEESDDYTYTGRYKFTKKSSEVENQAEGGADEPATAPQLKPSGNKNPNPESKPRPQ